MVKVKANRLRLGGGLRLWFIDIHRDGRDSIGVRDPPHRGDQGFRAGHHGRHVVAELDCGQLVASLGHLSLIRRRLLFGLFLGLPVGGLVGGSRGLRISRATSR